MVEGSDERALVRSTERATRDGDGDYYELWIERDGVSIDRYHGAPGQPREPRPLDLTWEQVGRFTRDVDNAFQDEEG